MRRKRRSRLQTTRRGLITEALGLLPLAREYVDAQSDEDTGPDAAAPAASEQPSGGEGAPTTTETPDDGAPAPVRYRTYREGAAAVRRSEQARERGEPDPPGTGAG